MSYYGINFFKKNSTALELYDNQLSSYIIQLFLILDIRYSVTIFTIVDLKRHPICNGRGVLVQVLYMNVDSCYSYVL